MSYIVMFRGRRACPCLAEWIPQVEKEAIRRKLLKKNFDIAQLIGGYVKSGGTHTTGGVADIWQTTWAILMLLREMGADASWRRTQKQGFSLHIHLVLRGCPHNGPARYQLTEVDNNQNGLVGNAKDDGPRPLSKRTWKQGIAWAKKLQAAAAPKPTPIPTPTTPTGGPMIATVGYGNLYMAYSYYSSGDSASDKEKLWTPEKERRSAMEMMAMGCSLYGVIEAHEENEMVQNWFKHWEELKPQYELLTGSATADGNGLIIDKNKYKLLRNPVTIQLPYARAMTRFNLEHLSSGVPFWTFVYHLIAGDAAKRDAQMKVVIEESTFASKAIHLCDVNGYSLNQGPVKMAMDDGLTDVFASIGQANVVNGHLPTHDGGEPGKNLDHIFLGTGYKANSLEIIDPGDLSDHKWLKSVVEAI